MILPKSTKCFVPNMPKSAFFFILYAHVEYVLQKSNRFLVFAVDSFCFTVKNVKNQEKMCPYSRKCINLQLIKPRKCVKNSHRKLRKCVKMSMSKLRKCVT